MHAYIHSPKEQAEKALADAAIQAGSSRSSFMIESRVVDESCSILESRSIGTVGDPQIVFFSQHPNHASIDFSRHSRLRIWTKLLKRAPILLDAARQLANKLIAYKKPKPPDLTLFQFHAENMAPAVAAGFASPRKTAVIAMHWLDVGGAEAFAIDCIKLACENGFRVVVVCDCIGPLTWLHKIEKYAAHIYLLGNLDEKTRRLAFFKLIMEYRPELIHIHHCRTAYELLPALRENGLQSLVMDSTHIVENRHGGFVSVSQRYSQWIDLHHVISKTLENFYIEAGMKAEKLRLGYLLSKGLYSSPGNQPVTLAKPLRIGFIGRLVQQKRPYLFVELAGRLSNKYPGSFAFGMIGEGILGDQIKQQADAAGTLIDIYPSQHDVKRFLSETDVLVICSDQEGVTLVAFEAIQNNCIVLSTDVGAQREIVPPGNLLPVEPYQFLRKATTLLFDIATGSTDCHQIRKMQSERYEALLAKPGAIDVCSGIYSKVFAGQLAQGALP